MPQCPVAGEVNAVDDPQWVPYKVGLYRVCVFQNWWIILFALVDYASIRVSPE